MAQRKDRRNRDGRFLEHNEKKFCPRGGLLMAAFLLGWNGVLLYMISQGLIVPVYGAGFVMIISMYLGNQL